MNDGEEDVASIVSTEFWEVYPLAPLRLSNAV